MGVRKVKPFEPKPWTVGARAEWETSERIGAQQWVQRSRVGTVWNNAPGRCKVWVTPDDAPGTVVKVGRSRAGDTKGYEVEDDWRVRLRRLAVLDRDPELFETEVVDEYHNRRYTIHVCGCDEYEGDRRRPSLWGGVRSGVPYARTLLREIMSGKPLDYRRRFCRHCIDGEPVEQNREEMAA